MPVQSSSKDIRTLSMDVFLLSFFLSLNGYFPTGTFRFDEVTISEQKERKSRFLFRDGLQISLLILSEFKQFN